MKLQNGVKILLVLVCLALSVAGFMIKLPSAFRNVDKQLHTVFYFLAAALLNILFAKRSIIRHLIIFVTLYLFGNAIELAQEYSNRLFHKRIHGRYDIEDVHANLKGLLLFSVLWIICQAVMFAYGKLKFDQIENSK